MRDFRLYVILDAGVVGERRDITELARQIILGGAGILQFRAKALPDIKILKIARAIKALIQKSNTLFVINDRVDLACLTEADGVHLGQDDLPIKEARKILGKHRMIGLSTHSLAQAQEAEKQGADYIAIGPMFPTATKPEAAALGPKIIGGIKDKVGIPFVAVGGITLDNIEQVLACGAQRVAVCKAIITAKDIRAATAEFRQRLH